MEKLGEIPKKTSFVHILTSLFSMIVTIGFPLRETSKPVWSILPCDVRPRILGGSHEATLRLSTAPEEVGAAACSGIAGRDDFKGRFWDGFSMISTYLNHEHQVKFCP